MSGGTQAARATAANAAATAAGGAPLQPIRDRTGAALVGSLVGWLLLDLGGLLLVLIILIVAFSFVCCPCCAPCRRALDRVPPCTVQPSTQLSEVVAQGKVATELVQQ